MKKATVGAVAGDSSNEPSLPKTTATNPPAGEHVKPSQQRADALAWLRHWKSQLPRLKGLPLLAVGAGPDRKAPANLRNGQPLTGWQNTIHTPGQIESGCKRICGAGTRTGKAAGGLLVLDVDGSTALSWLLERGCDPLKAQTWQIHRNTDPERLKVAWRPPPTAPPTITVATPTYRPSYWPCRTDWAETRALRRSGSGPRGRVGISTRKPTGLRCGSLLQGVLTGGVGPRSKATHHS
jgi:hypothetical protein